MRLNATIECTGSLIIGRKTKNIATKTIMIGIPMNTYSDTAIHVIYI